MRAWGRIPTIAVLLAVGCESAAAAGDAVPPVVASKFEFFVHDVADSRKFYAALGFSVAHMKTDGYSTLTSGSTVIALTPLPWWLPVHWFGFLRYPPVGTEVVLYSAHLESSKAALKERGYSPGEIRLQPWGHRDFRITDPDGYYIRVSEGVAVPSES
jgi:lactoylglutathione lyase